MKIRKRKKAIRNAQNSGNVLPHCSLWDYLRFMDPSGQAEISISLTTGNLWRYEAFLAKPQ